MFDGENEILIDFIKRFKIFFNLIKKNSKLYFKQNLVYNKS